MRQRLTELVHEGDPGLTDPRATADEILLLEGSIAHRGIDGSLMTRARERAARLLT